MHGAKNAYGGGQYPKRQILRIARSQIGNEESAHIKERVQKYARRKIVCFFEYDGEHCADQKGITRLLQNGEYSRAVEQVDKMSAKITELNSTGRKKEKPFLLK